MEKIIKYFRRHSGYARMKELKKASFQTRDIAHLLQEGIIVKVKPGLYRLANFIDIALPAITINATGYTISVGIMDVCRAIPEGVICLASALELYGLTTFNPSEIYVAIPNASKKPKIEYPPVKIFYFRDRFYRTGIEKIMAGDVTVNIYNMEKTICDVFRYRNKIGEDIALEGLKNYMLRKDASINKLREYAEICRVKTIMMPYLKALIKE
ncbi:MAG: type IV toxin-antitoxin system AbiEi family antitoxin domain-containing protein [Thermodesulfovibrionales bacterium]